MMLSKIARSITRVLIPTAVLAVSIAAAAQTPQLKVNPETGETQEQFAARTKWWREAKFGMFIHWGIYAVPADSTQSAAEWYFYGHTYKDPATGEVKHLQVSEYEKFASQFDPVKFDARKWVSIAKNAGMKYIVITSKHHDGFCMFDSKLTDYNIVKATPYKHDPMKDLARECKRQGIKLCFYHSVMDWHEPDYLPRREWDTRPTTGASLDRYIQHMEGQLRELLTNYGPIGGIWFDGGWEHNAQEEHALEVVKLIRSLQPGIMINNRINLPEDYDTPEQTIPANALPNGRLWETCMTMNDTWGYSSNDHNFKPAPDLIHKICDIASKGGNFLLNVGPDALGQIPPESIDRLAKVGEWMKVNGESIYATTKSPFKKLPFDGRCTQKGDTLYLQVFQWPEKGLVLTGLKTQPRAAYALNGHEELPIEINGGGYAIGKPHQLDPVSTVIKLEFAGAPVVEEVPVVKTPEADGSIVLTASDADLHGNSVQVETIGGEPNIGYWLDKNDSVSWNVGIAKAGTYKVEVEYACPDDTAGSTYQIEATPLQTSGNNGDSSVQSSLPATVGATGSWGKFTVETLPGTLALDAGQHTLRVVPASMPHGAVMNLRRITLKPVTD